MNIVIIEDERLTAQRLQSLIEKFDDRINTLITLRSVADSIAWFKKNVLDASTRQISVDLIFMDIHLTDGDAFQIIVELNLQLPIIFTTAFDEYMIKAFKVNSVDYLLKPVNFEDLSNAINKYKNVSKSYSAAAQQDPVNIHALVKQLVGEGIEFKDRFMVTVGTKIRTVKTETISYFYLDEKVVLLVTNDSTTLPIDYSLDKLMQILNPKDFFRVSRQFIVSLNAVQIVHNISAGKLRLDLIPKCKHEVFVSGDRVSDFKQWLGKD